MPLRISAMYVCVYRMPGWGPGGREGLESSLEPIRLWEDTCSDGSADSNEMVQVRHTAHLEVVLHG